MQSLGLIGMAGARWSDPGQGMSRDLRLPVARRDYAVWLIDRRTGSAHRVNGQPLVIHTDQPEQASAILLADRNKDVWETVVYPLGQGVEP
jgi:hypothetical protein